MDSTVDILLSTYNGEKYLPAQLDSIIGQDYPHWKLLVRDDGSNDGTITILNGYIQKYPGKITMFNDGEGKLGFSQSFLKLLKQSSAQYLMFCDQDDYWSRNKLSTMLSVMIEQESQIPASSHIVFSDLQVTDSFLNPVSPSFMNSMGYSSGKGRQIFFLKNYVPGCNMLFNKILVQQTLKTDNIICLHDHWLLMVCSSTGKLTYVDKPLMQYRVHDNNAIGFIEPAAPFMRNISLFFKNCLKFGMSNKKYRQTLYSKNIRQIENICEHLPASVSKDAVTFSKINGSNYFTRKIRNITRPYISEKALLKQLTYIVCF